VISYELHTTYSFEKNLELTVPLYNLFPPTFLLVLNLFYFILVERHITVVEVL